jgi:type IV secretion system protein VirB5
MSRIFRRYAHYCVWPLLLAARAAPAQFAVIDSASLAQLVQQAQTLAPQLQMARAQLAQAQSLYQSMTGSRDMQRLLSGMGTSSVPADWTQLIAAMQGGSTYTALAADVSGNVAGNAVLSASQMAALTPAEQAQIGAARSTVALRQGLAQQALVDDSARVNELQLLISAIASTGDQKGMLELQAAIGAERGLLQNEQTKLQVLDRGAQSEQWADQQRERELIVAGHGRFSSRFEPSPQ